MKNSLVYVIEQIHWCFSSHWRPWWISSNILTELHQRKSVEDVEKWKTKGEKLMSQTQGKSTGDAISLSRGSFFNTINVS